MKGATMRTRSAQWLCGVGVVGFVLVASMIWTTATAATATFRPGSPGLGDPYFPLDGNGGYDVKHYLLDIRYHPATDVLQGTATIRARATQDLSRFNLDFVGLTVDSITVGGSPATWSRDGGELMVTPANGIPRGQAFFVVVRYHGVPEPIEEGLGISGFVPTGDGAVVAGEPHVAATWFPANDHPLDKAAYTFRVKVPAGLKQIHPYSKLIELIGFYSGWSILPFDQPAAQRFLDLKAAKIHIGAMDLKIAAIAQVHQARLLSANLRDFRQVPGLLVEDWLS